MGKNKIFSSMMFLFAFFVVFGFIFSIIPIFIYQYEKNFFETAIPVTAEISSIEYVRGSDGERKAKAYVTYTIDGKDYERPLNFYSSSMREGDPIEIFYQPGDPHNINVKSPLLVLVFAIIGGVFFSIGLVGVLVIFRKKTEKDKLLKTGQRIYAEVNEVLLDRTLTVNGRHPYRIICKYVDPNGTLHFFKSEAIWYDPSAHLRDNMVSVYVMPSNYKKHYVKISDILPEKVNIY